VSAVGVLAGILLLACVVAHVVLVAGIAARVRWRAALAFAVPPLAVWWAWAAGVRWRVWIWVGAVAAYGIVVTIGGRGQP
jgi:hypothetical protein